MLGVCIDEQVIYGCNDRRHMKTLTIDLLLTKLLHDSWAERIVSAARWRRGHIERMREVEHMERTS